MDMIAPTTSSLRSSERDSQKLAETNSGGDGGAAFPFLELALDVPELRAGDFPPGFARDFDLLDEFENGVLSGIGTYWSIAQMVCFSF